MPGCPAEAVMTAFATVVVPPPPFTSTPYALPGVALAVPDGVPELIVSCCREGLNAGAT
jgi:hypothetical protein